MAEDQNTVDIAVIGCGTVGGTVARILTQESDLLSARLQSVPNLKYLVDVDFTHARSIGIDESVFCDDIHTVMEDESVQVIVELVGGTTAAREIVETALSAGKHVITANKALLAHHGAELFSAAVARGTSIAFEASCGGGIPVIRALTEGLRANRVDAIFGIVNGTCNFVLTEMSEHGSDYATALGTARTMGLAEADPTLDVSGKDSAHKLCIMASLAFDQEIDFDAIPVSGINNLQPCDLAFGNALGYVIKLLAVGERRQNGISLRVRPAFISREHPLARVSGSFNAVSVYGNITGHTMYYGRGAGGTPTASAVIADIASIITGNWDRTFSVINRRADRAQRLEQLPLYDTRSRYYLRILCDDKPGVLGRIATLLGKRDISISSVLQHEPAEEDSPGVPVVITTHRATEGGVQEALKEIDSLQEVNSKSICIEMVEEYPEDLE